ncbi:IclR family transcriptional regulator [Amycolatopsis jiangsuensis]|uniref:DNA-binding IclR family transcriptional regulator n=1 Tax=Amycolatopsis jiangsuensis TaxID=1181879 RepID=A0A840J473_9PSEU|nr:IclR family transcriptional regulator C-terminal domain-containing protein [Amycolatopsis jiangsuensis]MBB4688663.1 DNA-binding IclR family transcriptional regulator [Amycolatopsis jiangsuensis]
MPDSPVSVPGPRRTPGASSSRKVLQLLLSFTERRWEASVAELAEEIGSPVATTYRYVQLLKELHLLEEARSGRYHVTSRVMPLARAARLANDLARIARPAMEEAAHELGETILLFQHFGELAVCADRVECDRAMRFTFQPGHSIPLGVGATGKMLLALLPDGEREQHVARISSERGLDLRDELKRARENRHAQTWGEIEEGVWAASVPVDTGRMRPSVLSLVGPATRLGDVARAGAIEALGSYAQRIRKSVSEYAL